MAEAELRLTSRQVLRCLIIVAWTLIVLHLAGEVSGIYLGHDYLKGFIPEFDLDSERNVPTLFTSVLFLVNAGLFGLACADAKRRNRPFLAWLILGVVFCFLAVDEFSGIHERLIEPVRTLMHASGPLYFAWVVPYGLGVCGLAFVVGPTILRTRSWVRRQFTLAAVVYLTGALGFEGVGGWRASHIGAESMPTDLFYQASVTLEESLEIFGLVLLASALFSLMSVRNAGIRIELSSRSTEGPHARIESAAPAYLPPTLTPEIPGHRHADPGHYGQ